jgi:hypothetical protein
MGAPYSAATAARAVAVAVAICAAVEGCGPTIAVGVAAAIAIAVTSPIPPVVLASSDLVLREVVAVVVVARAGNGVVAVTGPTGAVVLTHIGAVVEP